MFFSKNLEEIDHCFFSKLGGVSTDKYFSLNCGKGSNDSNANVKRNLKFVADYYDLKINNIITLHQNHSNKAVIISDQNIKKYNLCFDGLVTNKKNIILGILTADCAPILFYDSYNMIVGACHAGWRGALTGIIENTLIKMKSIGSKIDNIRCAIGPCIGQDSYEVGKDFYNEFVSVESTAHQFFEKKPNEISKYTFSLEGYIIDKLSRLGINSINSIRIDTFKEDHICFSYRKSLIKKENDYGRMISTIVIKE